MHSSRMRTTCSSSHPREVSTHPPQTRHPLGPSPPSGADHPRSRPPQVWAWRPPGQIPLNFPLGCGPGDPPDQILLNFPHGCWPGNLQGMLGYHPSLETYCKACWDTACNACWDPTTTPPPREQNS